MNLHDIKKPYLLYVGNAYPHKNLERLLQAFKIVKNQRHDLSLVLVGKIDYFYQRLQELSQELGLVGKIIFAGQVSDQDLKWLYQNSLAYIFPSLLEGFGLPGLEAMAQGLPVISSDRGPLPEIYGSAAVYFNPEDIEEMALVIVKTVSDRALREKLSQLGQEQAKKYSWQRCAQETLEVYKKK